MMMEQTQSSETSAYKIKTAGNYSEEIIQHSEHGESLKSRRIMSTSHEEQCTVIIISHLILLKMKQNRTKAIEGNKTHILSLLLGKKLINNLKVIIALCNNIEN
jgi:hypothetical protein